MRKKPSIVKHYKPSVLCHLCGLPVRPDIVYVHHPLSGTIDHIIPRSKGGSDKADNRAPCHRCCNLLRGTRDIDASLKADCLAAVAKEFATWTNMPTGKHWRKARNLVNRITKGQNNPNKLTQMAFQTYNAVHRLDIEGPPDIWECDYSLDLEYHGRKLYEQGRLYSSTAGEFQGQWQFSDDYQRAVHLALSFRFDGSKW